MLEKNKLKISKLEACIHLAFWLFSLWMLNMSLAYENVEVLETDGVLKESRTFDYRLFPMIFIVLVGKMILVYGNIFYIFPKCIKEKNWKKMGFMALALAAVVFLLELSLAYAWSFLDERIPVGDYLRFWKLNAILFACYYGISLAYALSIDWWQNEKIRQELIKENLRTELEYLKSQINPHFFFNTLNNLYALSERQKNTDLSTGIACLSDLMRYMLYDAKAEKVALEKEILHLKNIIEVNQLRYGEEDDYTVSLNVSGNIKSKSIAPLIFAPFVENAFKHGIEFNKPSFIKIEIEANDDCILFEVINSNYNKSNDEHKHTGIGLKNVKRRLELIYPETHKLIIENKPDTFIVKLSINV